MDLEKLSRDELLARCRAETAGAAEKDRLLHELQVHQIELEAQNQALREAHELVEESRSRYADLYDFAPIAYCTFDRDGVVLEINLTGATMLGRERARIVGKPFLALVQLDDPNAFTRHIRRSLEASAPQVTELTLSIEQTALEVQLVSAAVRPSQGPATACRTAFLDISELRRAERQAREAHTSERVLRGRLEGIDRASAAVSSALVTLSASDVSHFLQVIVDQARAVVGAKYAALGIGGSNDQKFEPWVFSGMSSETAAAIGRTPRAIGLLGMIAHAGRSLRLPDLREHEAFTGFPPGHPPMTSFLAVPVWYQGHSRGNLYLASKEDGREFTQEDQILAEMLADRVGVALEIARLHQLEAQEHTTAKRSADRLQSAVESIEDALALFDADMRLVLCNSAYSALFAALLPEPLVGRAYAELLDALLELVAPAHPNDQASFRVLLSAATQHDRVDVRTRNGRSLRLMNRPTAEGGMVQTIWDLSQDVEREQELRDTRKAAEVASAAKSEFLSSMSHELRTPLNAILGFAQLLQRDKKVPIDERHRERVAHILKGGEHLLQLIDEVLDLSRIEAAGRVTVTLERVKVSDLLAEVQTTLEVMAVRSEIALIMRPVPESMNELMADRTRFKQILMNFGSNAIKYGRRGGRVEFSVSQQGACIRVTVADDGMGIAQDKLSMIFQPFQRAGQETGPIEGTGIGLAITKRLAELMDGAVGFESVAGRGSSFWIDLPAQRALTEPSLTRQASVSAASTPGKQGAQYRVVCIEDNLANVAFLRDLLSDIEAVELFAAPTAEIGLQLVLEQQPHAIIMDINLPTMSGFEAVRYLRERAETRDIPVIALSAAAMPKDAALIDAAGFDRYLTKPVDVGELTRTLQELLAQRPGPFQSRAERT